jgi:DNA-binding NarL/FixJ family response regulator
MAIKVVLAEDHTVVREGLKMLLQAARDIEIAGEAANGRQAVQLTMSLKPDVLILDLMMPMLNGFEAARQIAKQKLVTRVLILSSYGDIQQMHRLHSSGIAGYLIKQTAVEELLLAIRTIVKGKSYFSSSLGNAEETEPPKANGAEKAPLSSREAEILQLVAEGYPNKQIAAELNISIKTVQQHRLRLMNKLNVHGTASLTRHAISEGIVDPVLPG